MKILLAEHAGFCWGVKRVVKLSHELANHKHRPIYSMGPLIHNNAVISRLKEKGIEVLPADVSVEELQALPAASIVIIRAHGVPPEERSRLTAAGVELVDGTCPHVIQIQKKVKKAHEAGRFVLILGDKGHAEVTGLLGYCPGQGTVVSGPGDLDDIPVDTPVTVVCQSTLDAESFTLITAEIKRRFADIEIADTRCDATTQRQIEAIELCGKVDAMVVIGGRNSANTNRLTQICRNHVLRTYHIETAAELSAMDFENSATVGVTAGASTPDWIIEEVINVLLATNNYCS